MDKKKEEIIRDVYFLIDKPPPRVVFRSHRYPLSFLPDCQVAATLSPTMTNTERTPCFSAVSRAKRQRDQSRKRERERWNMMNSRLTLALSRRSLWRLQPRYPWSFSILVVDRGHRVPRTLIEVVGFHRERERETRSSLVSPHLSNVQEAANL